jgi:hypothetical protein
VLVCAAPLRLNVDGDCACAGIFVIAEIDDSAKFPTEIFARRPVRMDWRRAQARGAPDTTQTKCVTAYHDRR